MLPPVAALRFRSKLAISEQPLETNQSEYCQLYISVRAVTYTFKYRRGSFVLSVDYPTQATALCHSELLALASGVTAFSLEHNGAQMMSEDDLRLAWRNGRQTSP